jgi:hypothetical protein
VYSKLNRFIAVILTLTVLILIQMGASIITTVNAQGVVMTLSSQKGSPGTTVTLHVEGFTPRTLIKIYFASHMPFMLCYSDPFKGEVNVNFTVPYMPCGSYVISATDNLGHLATTLFTVYPGSTGKATPTPEPTNTPTPTAYSGTETPAPTANPQINPEELTLVVTVSSANVGASVNIKGALTANGVPLQGELVTLWYSVSNGTYWVPMASATTTVNGKYTIQWVNMASGTFMLKAEHNNNNQNTSANTTLSFLPVTDQKVFLVDSNSTLSGLVFNSITSDLSFTVSGPSGSAGYAKTTIDKSIVSDSDKIRAFIDGQMVNCVISSSETFWVVSMDYLHSTHIVNVYLDYEPPQTPKVASASANNATGIATATAILLILSFFTISMINVFRRRKQAT